jgi:hypothetical protein
MYVARRQARQFALNGNLSTYEKFKMVSYVFEDAQVVQTHAPLGCANLHHARLSNK